MEERLTRGFIVNRAFVADKWLMQNLGVSITTADEEHLRRFLASQPPEVRFQTWQALVAYGDDLVRRGMARYNPARGLQL